MPLLTKKGTFATNTALGTQAITGVGFEPKAVFFWGTSQTAVGYAAGLNFFCGGMAPGPSHSANAIAVDDAAATSNAGRNLSTNHAIVILADGGGVNNDALAVTSSFDADGFTIDWTDAPSSAWIIHYMAFGGDVLTNARVGFVAGSPTTGNVGITGIGFQPDFLLLTTIAGNGGPHANFAIGAASSPTARAASAFRDRDGVATTEAASRQISTAMIAALLSTSDAAGLTTDLVSFDADGFTHNVIVASSAATLMYLALKGGDYHVGVETQKTSTGTKATTGVGFRPSGLMAWSWGLPASASIDATSAKLSICGADGTDEGGIWFESDDNAADSAVDQRSQATKALGLSSQPSTTDAEADLTSFDADGFTFDWTTADAVAREFAYVAFGPGEEPVSQAASHLPLLGVG